MKRDNPDFDTSSEAKDVEAQVVIREWFVFSTLKNAFGGSSDTTLTRLREILKGCDSMAPFPAEELYKSLEIEPSLSTAEIDRFMEYKYQERYTKLILSLLYPDRDWKDTVFHEDHIFPKTEFKSNLLKERGYDDTKIQRYMSGFNTLQNLQLLTASENMSKSAKPFDDWLKERDATFCDRHLIPDLPDYGFDYFEEFSKARKELIVEALKSIPTRG